MTGQDNVTTLVKEGPGLLYLRFSSSTLGGGGVNFKMYVLFSALLNNPWFYSDPWKVSF